MGLPQPSRSDGKPVQAFLYEDVDVIVILQTYPEQH